MMNQFVEVKMSPLRTFVTAGRGGSKKAGSGSGGFVFQLLILFLLDLNRNLPSGKLRR